MELISHGVQCAFGTLSVKPMTWVSYRVPMADMPTQCSHPIRRWYNASTMHCSTLAKHPPTRGSQPYTRCWQGMSSKAKAAGRHRPQARAPFLTWGRCKGSYAESTTEYPDLLRRFLAAKLSTVVYTQALSELKPAEGKHKRLAAQVTGDPPPDQVQRDLTQKRIRYSFAERVTFTEPLRGSLPLTQKEIEDSMAIGGLRNTAASVSRLHKVTQFGAHLGQELRKLLQQNTDMHEAAGTTESSWVNVTYDAIGSEVPGASPPPSAIAAVKALLIEITAMKMTDAERAMPALTSVDAYLLEALRKVAHDPGHQIFKWLRDGAPTGIKQDLIDPGSSQPATDQQKSSPKTWSAIQDSSKTIQESKKTRLPTRSWLHTSRRDTSQHSTAMSRCDSTSSHRPQILTNWSS